MEGPLGFLAAVIYLARLAAVMLGYVSLPMLGIGAVLFLAAIRAREGTSPGWIGVLALGLFALGLCLFVTLGPGAIAFVRGWLRSLPPAPSPWPSV